MRLLKMLLIVFGVICLSAPPISAEDAKLLKVVVLSRHGVRSPTQDARVLSLWSQKTWPSWPVAKGELTPRGAKLITGMWENIGQKLRENDILAKDSCPRNIYVRADVDERTRATAAAILNGLAPGCGLNYSVAKAKIDPLFHPVKAGLYRYDAVAVATDVLAMTQGGLERLQDDFSGAMQLLNRISGPPAQMLCARFALSTNCQISDLPNAISINADGTGIRLVGGLGIASSMAEIFLLEYGQWPGESAGWGQVDARSLGQLLPIHARIFDVVNRAPVVAWANGSSLLNEMTDALMGNHPDKAVNDARVVVFVGHDTNLANIGGLLNMDWGARDYPVNGIPPGSALFLELWQKNGRKHIIASFHAQSMATLHKAFDDDGKRPDAREFAAESSPARINGVRVELDLPAFERIVKNATEGAPSAPPAELAAE